MIDKEKLKRRFSRNAKNYDQYAAVQKKMGDVLIENIKDHLQVQNILEIGCGTGYVTKKLKKYFPNSKITAVDIAPGMIAHIKETLNCEHVDFVCGDIEEMILMDQYDLIISNATFQWFNHLDTTIEKLIRLLKTNGILCFSTFGQNTFNELSASFKKAKERLNIHESITPSQSFYGLDELQRICKEIIAKNQFNMKMDFSEAYECEYFQCCKDFLYSVKKIGANNSQSHRNETTPNFIEKVMEIYDEDYLENGKVRATYHNLFAYMKNIK